MQSQASIGVSCVGLLNLQAWFLAQNPFSLDEDLEWEHMRRLSAACSSSPDISLRVQKGMHDL